MIGKNFMYDGIYRKKLLYISTHRGTKEGDLVIGGFAREALLTMPSEQVERFALLLTYPDMIIMEWIRFPQTTPKEIGMSLIHSMKAHLTKATSKIQ